ncbi:MAG: histidine kinase [Proteobacteria bacterium]|nr:histidine kinase [Pseudomonadota bacterium]MBU1586190.1 histidine kinase [Pseudomonadota bacterium]MBU2452054.1 histidine kinase [Pseudomonadota bacterium]MBU2628956.1 histidine kinase [Pseudomonadota bacterium]
MLVSLVPMASLGYKLISQGETLIQEKASSYLTGLAQRNADAIKEFMEERQNDMSNLSNMICLFGLDTTLLKLQFKQMEGQFKPYLAFFVQDKSGKHVFSTLENPLDPLPIHSTDKSGGSLREISVKDIFMFTNGSEQIPALMICTPLLNKSKENCGHLCALVDFRLVGLLLKKSNIEVTGEVYLVDKNGRFLSASRFGAKALKDRISLIAITGKEHGLHEIADYRGERVLQAYQKVDDFPWYVMADQDMAEILNRIKALGREAIVYGMLTAMVVFALALFISTLIVNILKAKYQYEKELEFQVIQKEKLASLGLLTSGIAHELNTPLANALLYTQIAKEELNEPGIQIQTIQQRLSTVVDEVRQGSKIIRNLLDFSRHNQNDSQTTNVNKTLTKLMGIAGPHCSSNKIKVETELEKDMPDIKADASTLQAILTNLVANAIEAMPKGGNLRLKTRYVPVLKTIKIEIADSGPGIPKKELIQIFNPFFTTKKPGEGTGLGLFVSHEMIRKLGGDIKVISSTGEESIQHGTIFTIELPIE